MLVCVESICTAHAGEYALPMIGASLVSSNAMAYFSASVCVCVYPLPGHGSHGGDKNILYGTGKAQ